MSLPIKTLTVPKGTTLTINGPAKSPRGFDLLRLAMSSHGTVIFSGPTELHDQKTGKLLATITGGSLPGTLHFTATAAGQNYGRKCVDDVKTMKAAQISCSAAKAMVGCSHDLHASFPKMPAGSLVSTICRVTCKACFAEPTRAGTVTKKVGGGKAVVKPKGLVQLSPSGSLTVGSLSSVSLGNGWEVKCGAWKGKLCAGPQVRIPSTATCGNIKSGWYNVNYGNCMRSSCNMFCNNILGLGQPLRCTGDSGGPNRRRIMEPTNFGSKTAWTGGRPSSYAKCSVPFPHGAARTMESGNANNMGVECRW
jgi:hypothetical protein